jgi:hypothetical protein
MITIFRRHMKGCKAYVAAVPCVQLSHLGRRQVAWEKIRQSLALWSWEAATKLIRDWEIHGKEQSVSVEDACAKFLADCEARNLSAAITKKYEYVIKELVETFGSRSVRSVSDLRTMRNEWKYAPLTAQKRLEYVRTIFSFCFSPSIAFWIAWST